MANVLSTLYPPLVDTFQSPFIYTDNAKITFSISPYNSYKEIKKIHVTLTNQKTNQNVFATSNPNSKVDGTVLTNGVWIVPFVLNNTTNKNSVLSGDYLNNTYTLTLSKELLKKVNNETPNFVCDCYYKVQLRFDDCTEEVNNSYLNDQRVHFSEWSGVTLLKAIPIINVNVTNFTDNDKIPQYAPGIIPIVGNISFNQEKTGEHLSSYQIEILDSQKRIIKDSGIHFAEETNSFNQLLDLTNVTKEGKYQVKLYLTTNNGYTLTQTYTFRLMDASPLAFYPNWNFNKVDLLYNENNEDNKILVTSEDGWVTITIDVPNILPPGYLFIKRASSLDNYLNWEIVDCTYFIEGINISTTFIDKSIGSLVNYKYSCQYLTTSGLWSKTIRTSEIVYPDFYDILVSRGDRQLAIRYNAQISSMTPVVNRIKIDTLGGKYPRFAQNARMHYKQFQITGTISAESDYTRKFISDLDYKEEMDMYNSQMNGQYIVRNDTFISNAPINPTDAHIESSHNVSPINNWWWERKFREEVIEWLNDGEPKLYRSMTEGNMIVMFDSISLTPNPQLGRRIWNFSATVYEVGDGYSLTDLDTLGIFSIKNDFNTNKNYSIENKGKITKTKVWAGQKNNYTAAYDKSSLVKIGEPFVQLVNNIIESQGTIKEELYYIPYLSLKEEIQDSYEGLYDMCQIEDDKSLYLTDVDIYFDSDPQWYDLTTINLKQNKDDNVDLKITVGEKDYIFIYDDNLKQYIIK